MVRCRTRGCSTRFSGEQVRSGFREHERYINNEEEEEEEKKMKEYPTQTFQNIFSGSAGINHNLIYKIKSLTQALMGE